VDPEHPTLSPDAALPNGGITVAEVDVLAATPSAEFLSLIPRRFARRYLVLSCGRGEDGARALDRSDASAGRPIEWVAAPADIDGCILHNLGVRLGRKIKLVPAPAEHIAQAIDRCYGPEDAAASEFASTDADEGAGERDLLRTQGKAEMVRLVDGLLFEALTRSASDVHIQPLADRTLVRFRVDGVLQTARELPASVATAAVSRIKVMGGMDVAERGAPQDGRATVSIGGAEVRQAAGEGGSAPPREGRAVDLRISTIPTSYGERAVVRLLDNTRGEHLKDFASLGMPADVQSGFLERVNRSSGIVLVTGPTGSGKTTTLYAALRWVAGDGSFGQGGSPRGAAGTMARVAGELNVMTVEDPIEYELSTAGLAVSQSQVNLKKGVTFASGLRHILRQDPDVVMVGEIRDTETARIAIQASLTGHLVLSTLHTNDAAGALTRLVDLGVESYLVASSLSAVLAQRLVRRVHARCAGSGCAECLHSGFLGRVGVFELLVVNDALRTLLTRGATGAELKTVARAAGMRTLLDEGRRLIDLGQTTALEVERVISGVEDV